MTEIAEGAFSPSKDPTPNKEEPSGGGEKERVKVRFCVFFDGTLNNRTNVNERENNTAIYQKRKPKPGKDANSYEGDRTNVAKMEAYIHNASSANYDYLLSTYIEGPGTEDLKNDSILGYALGMGDTGVKEKVKKGIERTVFLLDDTLKEKPIIEELVLDVFGFSRGAAGARFFIHKALSDKDGLFSSQEHLADKISAKGFEIEKQNVRVEFVGLYDTVSSEGLDHNDVRSLKLTSLKRPEVNTVVQLAAADEHRHNFALTKINSAGNRGKEIFLPGAHSDIGGGYRNNMEEELVLNESHDRASLEKDRQNLLSQGWFKEDEIYIESPPAIEMMVSLHSEMPPPEPHRLKSKRVRVDNSYAKIPLNIMAEFFCKSGVVLPSKFRKREAPSAQLSSVYQKLNDYAQKAKSSPSDWHKPFSPWMMALRNQYLHFSAHYKRRYLVLAAHKPNIYKGRRERRLIRG